MKAIKLVSLLLLGSFFLTACGNEGKKEEPNKSIKVESESSDSSIKANNDVFFKDGILQLVDLKITITDQKVIPVGEEGNTHGENPVIAFWYDITNLSDKEITPINGWIAAFSAYQDNDQNKVNELKVAGHPDSTIMDDQMAVIKKDGTLQGAWAYELTDTETPVILKATQGVAGKEIGEQEYLIK